jgi:hypothetical protein
MATPKPNSPSLAHTLSTVGARVEQFTQTLDAISEDIKSIEKWLQDSGVRIQVEVEYSWTIPSGLSGEVTRVESTVRSLAWAPSSEGKVWRIQWIEYVDHGFWDGQEVHRLERQAKAHRPLIETPAAIRLSLDETLARLVEEIASQIPAYTQETLIEGDLDAYDSSRPESGTGPWRVRFQTGPNIESTTGQRVYETWTDVLAAVARLTDASPEDLHLNGYSFTLRRLKVPVRVLRELKLM